MKSKHKLTKRAIVYVGYKCNAKCIFCYYRHKAHKDWRAIEEVKLEVARYRYFYKCETIDISGGEPTIYPYIRELVTYCKQIGLEPTIITNGFVLSDVGYCKKLIEAGTKEFLFSFYGLGSEASKVTGVADTYAKQKKVLEMFCVHNIPFRINITVHKKTTPQLVEMTRLAIHYGAPNINYIVFNPFYEWRPKIDIDFQEKYSVMAREIQNAIDVCVASSVLPKVCNMPFCLLKGYEKYVVNFMQISFNPHEWDFNAWNNYFLLCPSEKWFHKEGKRKRIYEAGYAKLKECHECSISYICDGFTESYAKQYGFKEASPSALEKRIKNPAYFIKARKIEGKERNCPNKNWIQFLFKDNGLIKAVFIGWKNYFRDRKNYYYNEYVKKYKWKYIGIGKKTT